MLFFYLIHHGKTDWNVEKRIQGHADTPLNSIGIKEGEALKTLIDPIPLTHCFSSDLLRAVQTAHIILKDRSIEAVTDKRLRERDFGKWQGTSNYLLPKTDEEIETDQALSIRVTSFLKEVIQNCPDGHVLIVTHWGIIKTVLSMILNIPLSSENFDLQPHFFLKISYSKNLWTLEELYGVYLKKELHF